MRREHRARKLSERIDIKKLMYISGSVISIAVIGFVITFVMYGNKMNQSSNLGKVDTSLIDTTIKQSTEETSSQFGKTVEESSKDTKTSDVTKYAVNTSNVENKIETSKSNSNTSSSSNTTKTEETKTEEKKPDPTFKKPVEGENIREYAKDKLVYSNTLEEWITHSGIDIKADKTTVVKASADGTVKSIKNDPRYGLTVVIEHNNGYTTVYSNLLTAEFVVKGEKVKQGQTIGTVGNTATFEISDEAHLHFEITKDGESLDPELYLKD